MPVARPLEAVRLLEVEEGSRPEDGGGLSVGEASVARV